VSKAVRDLNSEALFHLVARRWDLLVLLPLLAVVAAGLAWQVVPPRYESTARLLIQDQQTVNPFMKDMVEEWSAEKRMPLVDSIFQSHETSEQVLRKLGRLDVAATPEEINLAVTEFQDTFQVIGLGGELVLVKVRGGSPAEAYEAANALIEIFTERIVRPQRETVRASAIFFEEQLEQLRGEGPQTEIQPGVAPLPAAEEVSREETTNVRRALAEAEARLAAVQQEIKLSEEKFLERTPTESKLEKQLASARRRLYALKYTYRRDHPERAAVERRVDRLEEALEQEREDARAVLKPTSRSDKAAAHRALLLTHEELAAEVELLRNRLLTEDLSLYAEANPVWPVEKPVLPTHPLGPSIWLILPIALFAGLLLALIALAFFAAFDDAVRSEEELAEALGAPSLGRMPRGGEA
jgi:capsular polysaccharide biosynthesis protein